MNLTREQAIENHRKLWNWIADETERLKRKVFKSEYFMHMGIEKWPKYCCYCCEYAKDNAMAPIKCRGICPIQWSQEPDCDYCINENSIYIKWDDSVTYEEAAKYAREIANLPERSV